MAYGPDTVLSARLLFDLLVPSEQLPSPVEPDLSIDPDPIRAIFSTQASDESGLDAMVPLEQAIPSSGQPDGVHFLLPLPEGVSEEALELFGFGPMSFASDMHSTGLQRRAGMAGRCE